MLRNKIIKGFLIVLYLLLYIYTVSLLWFDVGGGDGERNMALHIVYTFMEIPIYGSIIFFSFFMSLFLPLKASINRDDGSEVSPNLTIFQIIFPIIVLIYIIFSFFNYQKYDLLYGVDTPILLLILPIIIISLLLVLGLFDGAINKYSFRLFNGLILLGVFDSLIILYIHIDNNDILYYILFVLTLIISIYTSLLYYKNKCHRLKHLYLYLLNVILAVINLTLDIYVFHFYYIITFIMLGLTIIDLLDFLVTSKFKNINVKA